MKKGTKLAAIFMVAIGAGTTMTAETVAYWNMQDAAPGTAAQGNSVVKSSVNSPALDAKVFADKNTKVDFDADVPGKVIVAGKDAKVINADNKSALKTISKYGVKPTLTVAGNKLLNLDVFTVEAFVKIIKIPKWGGVMMKPREKGNYSWLLQNNGDSGKIRVRVDSNPKDATSKTGFNQGINTNFTINDGKWHHVAVTYDALNQKLNIYGDYKLLISSKTALPMVYDDSPLTFLGSTHAGSAEELIDEVRISDQALSPEDFLKVK